MYVKKSKIPRYFPTRGYYLQIYETHYNKKKKISRNACVKTIGFGNDLRQHGIKDPFKYCAAEIAKN